ncbi:hypothetical protein [Streptomonospora wellingtoniae]|uniref:Uncharacterized protein n=1 Tax=Streptomonospora wellingtoniae TaxID=3075544 RepID=A0ABU2KYL9_9ACTN|nr:hypothetical protein [Streptomonospora sp. DSM 45055]MDT0304409.1 hypothetical protein [Streptomonospora sp. DSM 45055]
MRQRLAGILIGCVFGAVFVFVNAGAPMGPGLVVLARAAAVLALATAAVLAVLAARKAAGRAPDAPGADSADGRPAMFNRRYAAVVAAEVALLFGGFPALRALGAPVEANVAWIAVIVGLHFVALAAVWRELSVLVPGAGLTVLGAAGFALVGLSHTPLVPIVSGVLSGAVLLLSAARRPSGAVWDSADPQWPRVALTGG